MLPQEGELAEPLPQSHAPIHHRLLILARTLPCLYAHRSTAPEAPSLAGAADLPEGEFARLADATLLSLEAAVAPLEDHAPAFDLSNANGVLTVKLNDKQTYVLNKQGPNRQIWWSSPLTGPRRYGWHAGSRRWRNTRDGHDMLTALTLELHKLTGVTISVELPADLGAEAVGPAPPMR